MENIRKAISDYSFLMRILDIQLSESLTKERIKNLKLRLDKAQHELAAISILIDRQVENK